MAAWRCASNSVKTSTRRLKDLFCQNTHDLKLLFLWVYCLLSLIYKDIFFSIQNLKIAQFISLKVAGFHRKAIQRLWCLCPNFSAHAVFKCLSCEDQIYMKKNWLFWSGTRKLIQTCQVQLSVNYSLQFWLSSNAIFNKICLRINFSNPFKLRFWDGIWGQKIGV